MSNSKYIVIDKDGKVALRSNDEKEVKDKVTQYISNRVDSYRVYECIGVFSSKIEIEFSTPEA